MYSSAHAVNRRTFLGGLGAAVGLGILGTANGLAAAPTARDKFLQAVQSRLGCPYVFGAEGPNEFDCSGLVYWAWKQAGVTVSRTADAQYRSATRLTAAQLKPSDSVFFVNSSGVAKHTLIYAGAGKYYQASALYSEPDGVVYCAMPAYSGTIAYGRLVK